MRDRTRDHQQQTLTAAIMMLGLALTLFMLSEGASPSHLEPANERHLAIETLVTIGLSASSPEQARQALSAVAEYGRSGALAPP